MISQPSLPESLISLCMNILANISDSERDLIRVIVDVVTEIRLGEDEGRDRGMSMVRNDGTLLCVIRCLLRLMEPFSRWAMTILRRLPHPFAH